MRISLPLLLCVFLIACWQDAPKDAGATANTESKPDPVTEIKSEKKRYEAMINRYKCFGGGGRTHSDTINFTDATGLKQGFWKEYNSLLHLPEYKDDQLVQEGYYVDSKKWGLWKEYTAKGELNRKVRYESDKELAD